MDQFVEVTHLLNYPSVEELAAKYLVSYAEASNMQRQLQSERVFKNSKYQVSVALPFKCDRPGWGMVSHVSVIPLDGQPSRSWADMQEIKNVLFGHEYEAVEIYPAESRLVDCGANYHLWVFVEAGFQIPFGWKERKVLSC